MTKHDHHTVPKYYFKGFAIPDEPAFVWEYQRKGFFRPTTPSGKGNPVKRALSKASVITDFYGDVEDHLADREAAAKPVIEKIRTSSTSPRITTAEKEQLTDYIGLMMRRTTTGDQRTTSTWPTVLAKLRPQLERVIAAFAYAGRFEEAIKLQKQLDEYCKAMPREIRQESLKQPYVQVRARIIELTWQFLTTDRPKFLTSDNPVRFPEPEGLGHPWAFLLLPLSSTIALLASTSEFTTGFHLPTNEDRMVTRVSEEQVATLNHLSMTGAKKYVYYHAAEGWIAQSFA